MFSFSIFIFVFIILTILNLNFSLFNTLLMNFSLFVYLCTFVFSLWIKRQAHPGIKVTSTSCFTLMPLHGPARSDTVEPIRWPESGSRHLVRCTQRARPRADGCCLPCLPAAAPDSGLLCLRYLLQQTATSACRTRCCRPPWPGMCLAAHGRQSVITFTS